MDLLVIPPRDLNHTKNIEPDRQTHEKPGATVAVWQCSLLISYYLQAWDLLMLWWLGENSDMTKCHIMSLWLWKLMPREGQQQSAFTLLGLPQPSPYQAGQTRQRRVRLWSQGGNHPGETDLPQLGGVLVDCTAGPREVQAPLLHVSSSLGAGLCPEAWGAPGRRKALRPASALCLSGKKSWSFCGCHGSRDGERREQEWLTA